MIGSVTNCARCQTPLGDSPPFMCIVCLAGLCGRCGAENACLDHAAEVAEINERSRQTDGEGRRRIAEELAARRRKPN